MGRLFNGNIKPIYYNPFFKAIKYVGKEKDAESGLIYYGARYYAAWTCRFISVDPLASRYAMLNPYNYASNSPIGQMDIDGMQNPDQETSQPSQSNGGDSEGMVVPATADGTPLVNLPVVEITARDGAWDARAQELINLGGPIGQVVKSRIENGERGFQLGGIKYGEGLSGDAKKQHDEYMGEINVMTSLLYLPAIAIGAEFVAEDIVMELALGFDVFITPADVAKKKVTKKVAKEVVESKVDNVLVEFGERNVPVYRGGNNFQLKPNEFKLNKETGLVKPTHGVSLDVDPNTVSKFGGAYKIESLPDGLKVIQRGQRKEHFEIVPSNEMSIEKFQSLLNQIKVTPYRN